MGSVFHNKLNKKMLNIFIKCNIYDIIKRKFYKKKYDFNVFEYYFIHFLQQSDNKTEYEFS
jgi:hypothetical protein